MQLAGFAASLSPANTLITRLDASQHVLPWFRCFVLFHRRTAVNGGTDPFCACWASAHYYPGTNDVSPKYSDSNFTLWKKIALNSRVSGSTSSLTSRGCDCSTTLFHGNYEVARQTLSRRPLRGFLVAVSASAYHGRSL